NATEFQNSSIAGYAFARSGSALVQTGGLSVVPGNVGYGDATPTQVRARVYRTSDNVLVADTYTDVGYTSTENWSVPYNYQYISTYYYSWYGVYYNAPTY